MDSKSGLREWIANRLLDIAEKVPANLPVRIPTTSDPFLDDRLRPSNLPLDPQNVSVEDPATGKRVEGKVELFKKPGEVAGTRRAISEIGKWLNYVTENRFLTVAADLSDSINIEHAHFLEHYDPEGSFAGTRIKAPIEEAVNASSVIGLVGQSVSSDPNIHAGVWGLSGTYGAFTPLMYTPARVFSQQNQDSPFKLGVFTVLAGHSGPETAADARTHFGIFAPQVWTLFPRGEVINLYFWDYNDVAPGFFAAVEHSVRHKESGLIVIHVARPDFPVADRETFADTDVRAAAKGVYLLRDYDPGIEKAGTVFVQGSSSTVNLVKILPELEKDGINIRVAAVISEDLFRLQPHSYQESILPDDVRYDSMFVTTMTKRIPVIANLGPLTEEYSLTADWDDRWRTGGSEADVIAESRLDPQSILDGIRRFARDRSERLKRQRSALDAL
jgi:transketolase